MGPPDGATCSVQPSSLCRWEQLAISFNASSQTAPRQQPRSSNERRVRFLDLRPQRSTVGHHIASTSTVSAAGSPFGIWFDHTGRGAVEIADRNGELRDVWFKDPKNAKDGCNFQIIGNVRPVGANRWDGGWIIDPDKAPNKKYDVEITPQGDEKLKVMGYAGMKFLSATMI